MVPLCMIKEGLGHADFQVHDGEEGSIFLGFVAIGLHLIEMLSFDVFLRQEDVEVGEVLLLPGFAGVSDRFLQVLNGQPGVVPVALDKADNPVSIHLSHRLFLRLGQTLHGTRLQHGIRHAVALEQELAILVKGGEVEFPQVLAVCEQGFELGYRGIHLFVFSLRKVHGVGQ